MTFDLIGIHEYGVACLPLFASAPEPGHMVSRLLSWAVQQK